MTLRKGWFRKVLQTHGLANLKCKQTVGRFNYGLFLLTLLHLLMF